MPRPSVLGARRRMHRVDLLRGELDDRPDVQLDAVPQQPPARRSASLEAADPLEGLAEDALELRQRGDPPLLVAHRRQVAYLGEREQALVLRVRVRDAAEHVDVLRRRQAARGRSSAAATVAVGAPSWGAARGAPRPRRAPRTVCRNVSASIAAMPRPRSGCATAITIRCSASGNGTVARACAQCGGELLVRRRLAGEIGVEVEHREVVARERGDVAGEGVQRGGRRRRARRRQPRGGGGGPRTGSARSAARGRRWTRARRPRASAPGNSGAPLPRRGRAGPAVWPRACAR